MNLWPCPGIVVPVVTVVIVVIVVTVVIVANTDFQGAVCFSMLKRPQCAVNCSTLVCKVLDLRPQH